MYRKLPLALSLLALRLYSQEKTDPQAVMSQILERLDTLEKDNRELVQEVRTLREELNASRAPAPVAALADRVAVEENRTAEQAQTKVEAANKFPIQLNGTLLFNAFVNSANDGKESASDYGLLAGPNRSGATVRQTLLGLTFQGPALPGSGRVNGSLTMDFWAGSADPGSNWLRLRRADVSLDWANRSFTVGQDKPLISPYQPDSLAEVGVPPLAGSGNLWLWLPQARYEERLHFGTSSGLTAQVALLQTEEDYSTLPNAYVGSFDKARPALEGRLAFWHKFDDSRRIEVAPGFHVSTTHVDGRSVNSHIASLDWSFTPSSHFEWKGTVYRGQNVAGLGALGNGFGISRSGYIKPIESSGGWTQFAVPITSRLTWNLFGGFETDGAAYLGSTSLVHEFTYASNIMYHIGPNVVISAEGLQLRTRSVSGDSEIHNHYDVALGYLF
ncbi:MAG TPA: hypothetical protein VGL97_07250 [Bryobacteraceae bacterium]|jgi:hypothetical protein